MRMFIWRTVGTRKSRKQVLRLSVFVLLCGIMAFTQFPFTPFHQAAAAARVPEYKALEVGRSTFLPITIAKGQKQQLTITFKNIGSKTWTQTGSTRVAINTSPIGRISKFQDSSWSSSFRPARMAEKSAVAGATASFTLTIKAPNKNGEYVERFSLARVAGEIPGGDFALLINVSDKAPSRPLYAAKVTSVSDNAYSFKPGEGKTVWVEVQNTGRATWVRKSKNPIMLETANPRMRASDFTLKWITFGNPNDMKAATVKPGERVKINFALLAPKLEGAYTESFDVVARGLTALTGSQFDLNILVKDPNAPTESSASVIPEPMIRVGITYLNNGFTVQPSLHHVFSSADGTKIAEGAAQAQSVITYASGTYTLVSVGQTYTTTQPIRITPDPGGVVALVNYRTNYDTFRNVIEIHYADATKRLWAINELPMDQYLSGLAEATSGQHPEYMKSLAVAARSYALWHWYVSSKHKSENYTINATTDQVYRGYNYEIKMPDFVQAVQDTRGIVMTHPSAGFDKNPLNIALGAYSSGTDGRTRSFTEVWGGKPEDWEWMVSVPDPLGIIPDALTRPGNHMVGMSATGALRYAVREGRTFDWILKHYYTGIALQKLW